MPRTRTETATKLETHQKVALSFVIATAVMVLVSVILAGTGTLTAKRTDLVQPADRSFETTP